MGLAMWEHLQAADREEFLAHQARRRQELWGLLGDLPQPRTPQAKLMKTTKHVGHIRFGKTEFTAVHGTEAESIKDFIRQLAGVG
jgi:hypothetical protein